MGGGAPDYPYTLVTINPSAGQTLASEEPEREQAYQQQQERQQQQQAQYDQQQQQQAQQQYDQQQAQQQQQQYGQQQAQYGQQQTTQAQYGQQQAATDQLPAGWIALQDPSSGQTYYANQTTGETSWERPAASVLPQQPISAGVSGDASYASNGGNTGGTPSSKAHNMTKYGDGFVTSASHPELASQYGNHGTSNPYHGAERPGTTAAVVGGQTSSKKAPVSGSLNFDEHLINEDHNQVKDTLLRVAEALIGCQLNPVEKRQLAEAEKASPSW
jgi:protein transport protein SEC31